MVLKWEEKGEDYSWNDEKEEEKRIQWIVGWEVKKNIVEGIEMEMGLTWEGEKEGKEETKDRVGEKRLKRGRKSFGKDLKGKTIKES